MIQEPATVTALDGTYAWVQTEAGSACGSCGVSGCGGAVLGSIGGSKVRRYRVANPDGAGVGERVTLAVPEGALVRASLYGYLLPLLGIVGGAMLGAAAGLGDAAVAGVTLTGAALAALFSRRLTARTVGRLQPVLFRSGAVARPVILHSERGMLS